MELALFTKFNRFVEYLMLQTETKEAKEYLISLDIKDAYLGVFPYTPKDMIKLYSLKESKRVKFLTLTKQAVSATIENAKKDTIFLEDAFFLENLQKWIELGAFTMNLYMFLAKNFKNEDFIKTVRTINTLTETITTGKIPNLDLFNLGGDFFESSKDTLNNKFANFFSDLIKDPYPKSEESA